MTARTFPAEQLRRHLLFLSVVFFRIGQHCSGLMMAVLSLSLPGCVWGPLPPDSNSLSQPSPRTRKVCGTTSSIPNSSASPTPGVTAKLSVSTLGSVGPSMLAASSHPLAPRLCVAPHSRCSDWGPAKTLQACRSSRRISAAFNPGPPFGCPVLPPRETRPRPLHPLNSGFLPWKH